MLYRSLNSCTHEHKFSVFNFILIYDILSLWFCKCCDCTLAVFQHRRRHLDNISVNVVLFCNEIYRTVIPLEGEYFLPSKVLLSNFALHVILFVTIYFAAIDWILHAIRVNMKNLIDHKYRQINDISWDYFKHRFKRLSNDASGSFSSKDILVNWNCRFYERLVRCVEYNVRAIGLDWDTFCERMENLLFNTNTIV